MRNRGVPSGGVTRGSDALTRGHYYPAIDGLRAFAVLAVIAFHTHIRFLSGGFLGVDVFFVISGFVITLTLLREHERTGRLNLWAFYRRRWWRLMPALVACVALALVVGRFGQNYGPPVWVQAITSLTYTYNIAQVVTGSTGGGILSHIWSLSVEEQFYLIWAPLLAVVLGVIVARRSRVRAAVVAVVAFAVLRTVTALATSNAAAFFLPWSRFDEFLCGALVAVALHGIRERAPRLVVSPWPAVAAAAGLVVIVVLAQDLFADWLIYGGFLLVALLTAVVVGHAYVPGRSPLKVLLGWGPMVWLGQRSYGLYLYHWLVLVALSALGLPGIAVKAGTVLVGVGLAAVSYRWLETPLRQRGARRASASAELHPGERLG